MTSLLPPDFDVEVETAVQRFWQKRLKKTPQSQQGGRGAVIAGKNLDGFSELIKSITIFCGLPDQSVIIKGRNRLVLPGYFRPTKMWDAVVIYKGLLVASFELKSQVGSFGNNFNNRTEESVGSAHDFWTAHTENAFQLSNAIVEDGEELLLEHHSKPPFLAYLMLLESCNESQDPVNIVEKNYNVFQEFCNTSYVDRYRILCEKLVRKGLYSSTCLILSDRVSGLSSGKYISPVISLSPRNLFAEFAGRLLAVKEIYG